jgi:hypothetical protein
MALSRLTETNKLSSYIIFSSISFLTSGLKHTFVGTSGCSKIIK